MGRWMSQSVSQSVRDVCISHQSDWIYYNKLIKFLVVKVNGTFMWGDLIPIRYNILEQNDCLFSSAKMSLR